MSGPQFFETRMGQTFYDGTMRRVADALQSIATSLEFLAELQRQEPKPPARRDVTCADYRPDHNGECLNCDEPADAHPDPARVEAWHALVGEMVELLHEHDTAWDNEEESVKEEHAALIARTSQLLSKLRGRKDGASNA